MKLLKGCALGLAAVGVVVGGKVVIGRLEQRDRDMIERCKTDAKCVNSMTGKGFVDEVDEAEVRRSLGLK